MGGAVLLRALAARSDLFERCILSAPMIGLSMVRWPALAHQAAKWLAAAGFSRFYVPGGGDQATFAFPDNPLTRDERRHAISANIFRVAPDLAIGSPTIGWTATSFDAMADLQQPETARHIQTRILVVAGPRDRITATPVAEAFVKRLPNGRFLPVADAEHEVLLEIEPVRLAFWQAFDAFMAEP
jgi:lysophospholipase